MEELYLGVISFEGYKTFDTLEEARVFTNELGDRWICIRECRYPDMTFYIVEYDTPRMIWKEGKRNERS